MGLVCETLIISLLMAAACTAPWLFRRIRAFSQVLLLIGTGSLLGIYFFDLLPDVLEIGGRSSLWIILAVWAVYSVMHSFHLHHHQHEHGHESAVEAEAALPRLHVGLLMTSMVAHCLASGMFLSLSRDLSSAVESGVFWAILAHKGYEALSVSLVLQERVHAPRKLVALTSAYALSFPAGVLISSAAASFFSGGHEAGLRTAAMIVASVGAGSLMGCMVHDFVIPSLRQVRQRRSELVWVAAGLAATLVFSAFL